MGTLVWTDRRRVRYLRNSVCTLFLNHVLRLDGRLIERLLAEVGGQAVLGRQDASPTPWLTERHGYDPTWTS